MLWVCTSFGGSSKKSNLNYAKMSWYMLNNIRKWDAKEKVKLAIGATKGHAHTMASKISNNIEGCFSFEIDCNGDKFSSKISILKKVLKFSRPNDCVFYVDCDVYPYGSIEKPMHDSIKMSKLLVTEMRLERKEVDKKFRSWIVGLKNNSKSLDFIDIWKTETERAGSICTDQEGLWNAFLKMSSTKGDVIDYRKTNIPLYHTGYIKIGSKWERGKFLDCPEGWKTVESISKNFDEFIH